MSTNYVGPGRMVAHNMVTTQFDLDGFRVTRTLGVVRGIVVRSRSIFGTIGAGLQTLVGGNITLLTNLCEKTRAEAFDRRHDQNSEPVHVESHIHRAVRRPRRHDRPHGFRRGDAGGVCARLHQSKQASS